MDAQNPLCTPTLTVPFDHIRPEHVEPAIDALLVEAQAEIDRISERSGAPAPTYEDTLGALEQATERLEFAMGLVGHLESVAMTAPLRDAYNAAQPKVSAFYAAIPLNEGLWRMLRAFAETPESRALPEERARFLKKTLDDFRRHGALLDKEGKDRLQALHVELSQLCTRFAQNVLDATAAFELYITDEARLAGLPEGVIALLSHGAKERGKDGFRLTLHEPILVPVLTYLDDESLRKELWRAYNQRAATENGALLGRIVALRTEQARLLGFAHFADLVLENRMAKSGARALGFVDDLRSRTQGAFAREHEELRAFRKETEGRSEIAPWDLAYYAEKLRRARYAFDEEALRPYLPLPQVLSGLFSLAQTLYGVHIEPWAAPTWHESVRAYAIFDESGRMIAGFYTDLFPRDEKRGGAWMNPLRTGAPGREEDPRHLAVLAANVRPPMGDQPALLSHRELETLLHEFGHLMHQCLSRVPLRSLGGANVAWDFVELPSQIMENFAWERPSLDLLSGHVETGAKLPDDLLDKMRQARTFRAASAMMRQLGFGTCDLRLHTEYDPQKDGDAVAYGTRILAAHAPAELPKDHAMLAGFTHLFGSPTGYAAGYYSYKWAEVLDADAFSRFQEDGVMSQKVGRAFHDAILSRGDSRDPMDLFIAFRGREPELQPLLIRSGLS